jgi:hypothetical protein
MGTVLLLAVLWAVVGIPLVVRHLQERRALPMEEFQRAMGALQPANAETLGLGRRTAGRRRLVSTLTYLPGLALLGVGIAMSDTSMMAVGLSLVNLGTAHRLIALSVDRSHARQARAALGIAAVPSPTGLALDPGIDEPAGDAQTWGDGWQIIGPEPRRVDDLVLVDADVS